MAITNKHTTSTSSASRFKIISANVHSITPRLLDIQHLVTKHAPHILCVQESWLNGMIANDLVSLRVYTMLRVDRANQSGYGGVILYVRSDVSYRQLNIDTSDTHEGFWISLSLQSMTATLANICRPPSHNLTQFISTLERTIAGMHSFVLVGDFNVNVRYSKPFQQFLDRYK